MPLAWGSISFNLSGPSDLHAFEAVGEAAAVQFLQARQFGWAGGDDNLAADFIGNIVGVAKRHELGAAADAALGFQRSRPVVQARNESRRCYCRSDGAPVALLSRAAAPDIGMGRGDFQRRGQAEDAAADDRQIVLRRHESGQG